MDCRIWDMGEEHYDRFTVVYPDGDYVGMSVHPFHPQGFCQHGSSAEFEPDVQPDKDHNLISYLGKLIGISDLPEDCQIVVKRELHERSLYEQDSADDM